MTTVSFDQVWSRPQREHSPGFMWNALFHLLSALGKEGDLFLSETGNWFQRSSINTPYMNENINDYTERKCVVK